MIKAEKNKVEMAGSLETISAEFIAIQRAFIVRASQEEMDDTAAEARRAIQLYESWTAEAKN